MPVYSLKHELLFDQTLKVINLIHLNSGFVFYLISDNIEANHACFKMYLKNYGSDEIFSCNYPILNEVFKSFYLLCNPTRLFKNIKNSRQTENM